MLIVQKYGGTSVGSPEKIKSVARKIAKTRQDGGRVVVVVSAMGHTTDELLALARQVTDERHPRELDVLLSAGERIAMALLSMALRDVGVEAISFTGSQAGIITDESHTRARIVEIRPVRVVEELEKGRVVIVAGFQGVSREKEITTLGRGGSDTTAVAMAVALKADRCEIYTDVPGVFSADPRVVPGARRFKRLPLGLMHEMAVRGAQVMHAPSIEIAEKAELMLSVGLAQADANGGDATTWLVADRTVEAASLPRVVAVVSNASERRETEALTVSVIAPETADRTARARLEERVRALVHKAGAESVSLTSHPRSIRVGLNSTADFSTAARIVNALHDELIAREQQGDVFA